MLSTNPRTHILELTRDREIPITEMQYKQLKASQKLSSYNDVLEIKDPDTWKILHDWLWKDFAWFKELERVDTSDLRYICDFATRHPISESCGCPEKYWFYPVEFRSKLYELYPNKYPSTITEDEKREILKSMTEERNKIAPTDSPDVLPWSFNYQNDTMQG